MSDESGTQRGPFPFGKHGFVLFWVAVLCVLYAAVGLLIEPAVDLPFRGHVLAFSSVVLPVLFLIEAFGLTANGRRGVRDD